MKKIIVTGSSSGFGLLTVKTLAKQGHTVYATMRNLTTKNAGTAQEIKNWAKENQVDIRLVELDVTSDESVTQAVAVIAEDGGDHIDVLINNAGLFIAGLSESLSTKQVEQIFQVNVFGAVRMNKAVLPYMHKQNSGLLIHVSSGLSRLHLPYLGAYSAAKAAIDTLAETLHYELRETGIDAVVVQPGAYPSTDLFSKQIEAEDIIEEQKYGEYGDKIKKGIQYLFSTTPESPNPIEVAQLFGEIINLSKDKRTVWSAIGIGAGQPLVEGINKSTQEFSLYVQGALGMI